MFPDLQTDPDFPAWAEDADPASLQAQEVMVRQNDLAEERLQWPANLIEDRLGNRWWVPSQPAGTGGVVDFWALDVDGERKTARLAAPMLVAGVSDLATGIQVTNLPVPLAAGRWLVLEADNLASSPLTFTLKSVAAESGGGLKTYDFQPAPPFSPTLARIPLYRLEAVSGPRSEQLVAGVHATRYVGGGIGVLSSHMVFVPNRVQLVAVPRMMPL